MRGDAYASGNIESAYILSLNPNDNQGVRFCLDDAQHELSWEDMHDREERAPRICERLARTISKSTERGCGLPALAGSGSCFLPGKDASAHRNSRAIRIVATCLVASWRNRVRFSARQRRRSGGTGCRGLLDNLGRRKLLITS